MLVDLLLVSRQLVTLWLSLYLVITDGDILNPRFFRACTICMGLMVGSDIASRRSLPSSAESWETISSSFDVPLRLCDFISCNSFAIGCPLEMPVDV